MDTNQLTDNTEKYARGGIEGRLLGRFEATLSAQARQLAPNRVLDAGCGEGVVTGWLAAELPNASVSGVEARPEALAALRAAHPGLEAVQGDLYALPFDDGAFDLVVCTEVLEHLVRPADAMAELARVSAGHVLVTVPWEPWFRLGNLARGRYVGRGGSTPGHVNTWGPRGLRRLVSGSATGPARWHGAFPWQMAVVPVSG